MLLVILSSPGAFLIFMAYIAVPVSLGFTLSHQLPGWAFLSLF